MKTITAKEYLNELGLNDWSIEHQTEEGMPIKIRVSELMEDYRREASTCTKCDGSLLEDDNCPICDAKIEV